MSDANARQMAEDHAKANNRLEELARADRIILPKEPDEDHRVVRQDLQKLSGAAFDRTYIHSQLQDHQKTAQLLEYEIDSGEDPELKQFAVQTLPIVLAHLRMAQNIDQQLAGQPSVTPGSPVHTESQ